MGLGNDSMNPLPVTTEVPAVPVDLLDVTERLRAFDMAVGQVGPDCARLGALFATVKKNVRGFDQTLARGTNSNFHRSQIAAVMRELQPALAETGAKFTALAQVAGALSTEL